MSGRMVGARGFEPPTPWSRNGSGCSNLLILLVRCCVVVHRFSWYLGRLDPRLDPTFDMVPQSFQFLEFSRSMATYRCSDAPQLIIDG
jgi:hypothetical protein